MLRFFDTNNIWRHFMQPLDKVLAVTMKKVFFSLKTMGFAQLKNCLLVAYIW